MRPEGRTTTFRPLDLETDAAEIARLYSTTVAEPITVEIAREWWTLRENEIRFTTLAFDDAGRAVGYWDVNHESWMKPGYYRLACALA